MYVHQLLTFRHYAGRFTNEENDFNGMLCFANIFICRYPHGHGSFIAQIVMYDVFALFFVIFCRSIRYHHYYVGRIT